MKILAICSYLCAAVVIVFFLLALVLWLESGNTEDYQFTIVFLFLLLPPIAQIVYTLRTYRMYYLPEYKETKSLDDFLLNDMDSNDNVVSTGFWLKTFSIVNSILLCLFFIMMS